MLFGFSNEYFCFHFVLLPSVVYYRFTTRNDYLQFSLMEIFWFGKNSWNFIFTIQVLSHPFFSSPEGIRIWISPSINLKILTIIMLKSKEKIITFFFFQIRFGYIVSLLVLCFYLNRGMDPFLFYSIIYFQSIQNLLFSSPTAVCNYLLSTALLYLCLYRLEIITLVDCSNTWLW